MLLALDLSLVSTGYAVFNEETGENISHSKITPPDTLNNYHKKAYIEQAIMDLLFKYDCKYLVIEDVFAKFSYKKGYDTVVVNFYMLKELLRLSGGVEGIWFGKHKVFDPIFYVAGHARKLVGIPGNAHKVEVQLWIIDHYHVAFPQLLEYITKMEDLKDGKLKKEITKGQFDYRMKRLSREVEKETGYGEDECDALVLGLAFIEDFRLNNGKIQVNR